jgi:hypothetical protein
MRAPWVTGRQARKGPKLTVREARPDDINRVVEIDLECFPDVYEANPVEPEEIRRMMMTRLGIAQELMVVGEIDGCVEGTMTCQRTNLESDQIKSWEETTNNGTLVDTHMTSGKTSTSLISLSLERVRSMISAANLWQGF